MTQNRWLSLCPPLMILCWAACQGQPAGVLSDVPPAPVNDSSPGLSETGGSGAGGGDPQAGAADDAGAGGEQGTTDVADSGDGGNGGEVGGGNSSDGSSGGNDALTTGGSGGSSGGSGTGGTGGSTGGDGTGDSTGGGDTGGSAGGSDSGGGSSGSTGSDDSGGSGGTNDPPPDTPADPQDPPADDAIVAAGATLEASRLSIDRIVSALTALGDLQRKVTETEEEQNASALRRVQAYRFLLGLQTDITLDPGDVALADAAADICMQLGTLTHSPSRPAGMSDEQYDLARRGAAESNLASRYPLITIPYSIDLYMDDSDSYNIDRVGHRRWIMSPLMRGTGFGLSSNNRYSAMHVFPDEGLGGACFSDPGVLQPWDMILYPRWGYMPTNYFAGSHVAWSISLRGDRFNADNVTAADVTVHPVDADNNPTGAALTLAYFNRSTANYGCQHPVLIFRPQGIQVAAGRRYRVSVNGVTDLSGNPQPIDYWVEFFTAKVTVIP